MLTEDVRAVRGALEHSRSWVSAWFVRMPARVSVHLIASRDVGHHTSGWWKNPDYERCEHLSLSAWDADRDSVPLRIEDARPSDFVAAFFGPHARLVWEEGPAYHEGRHADVHHYRVFCDAHWAPILPRGEEETSYPWNQNRISSTAGPSSTSWVISDTSAT